MPVVDSKAFFDLLLKGESGLLHRLFDLARDHLWFGSPGEIVSHLAAVEVAALGDSDFVGNAILSFNLSDAGHLVHLLPGRRQRNNKMHRLLL